MEAEGLLIILSHRLHLVGVCVACVLPEESRSLHGRQKACFVVCTGELEVVGKGRGIAVGLRRIKESREALGMKRG